jgi:hypothetical protein
MTVAALKRTGLESLELFDRLEFDAGAATIAFEMAGADVVVAVSTMRHVRNLGGHWRS